MTKRGVTGGVNLEKGNAATFLLMIEGVLDGLFRDMVSLDNSEAKVSYRSMLFHWLGTSDLRFRRNLAVHGPFHEGVANKAQHSHLAPTGNDQESS